MVIRFEDIEPSAISVLCIWASVKSVYCNCAWYVTVDAAACGFLIIARVIVCGGAAAHGISTPGH